MNPFRWFLLVVLGTLLPLAASAQADPSAETPTVEGIEVSRADGSFLGVAVEGRAIVVRFYDEEKEQIAPDVPRGTVRWRQVRPARQEFSPMNLSGDFLRSLPQVKPPYTFIAFINFLNEDGQVTESHSVDLKQIPAADGSTAEASNY